MSAGPVAAPLPLDRQAEISVARGRAAAVAAERSSFRGDLSHELEIELGARVRVHEIASNPHEAAERLTSHERTVEALERRTRALIVAHTVPG